MSEGAPTTESLEKITRQQVIDTYKKFVEQGVDNPDTLDLNNPEVIEANQLFERWVVQEDAEAKGNEDIEMRTNFEKTMLYVDAGFNNPDYLNNVLGWLSQDAHNAEKDTSNPARIQLRHDVAEAIARIRNLTR